MGLKVPLSVKVGLFFFHEALNPYFCNNHLNLHCMKRSKIQFEIELDDQNVPERIVWDATEKEDEGPSESKSISISLWDHLSKNTLRIDLWSKDMPVDEQKKFYVDCIGGLAQSILSATGDEYMAGEMNKLCDDFIRHIREEERKQRQNNK